jgi:mono/diheme cytochrome c family protein
MVLSAQAIDVAALRAPRAAAQDAPSQDRRSIWDGVYTDEQATGGKVEYEYYCASCHLYTLGGDPVMDVPPLTGDEFIDNWAGRTVRELLDVTTESMPADDPASLNADTYANVVAYVLRFNGFPAAEDALSLEAPRLDRTVIDKVRPGTGP